MSDTQKIITVAILLVGVTMVVGVLLVVAFRSDFLFGLLVLGFVLMACSIFAINVLDD